MSRTTSRYGHNIKSADRNQEIDLTLAVMCVIQRPGEMVPYHVISELAGLSHGGAWTIAQQALKKIRNKAAAMRSLSA